MFLSLFKASTRSSSRGNTPNAQEILLKSRNGLKYSHYNVLQSKGLIRHQSSTKNTNNSRENHEERDNFNREQDSKLFNNPRFDSKSIDDPPNWTDNLKKAISSPRTFGLFAVAGILEGIFYIWNSDADTFADKHAVHYEPKTDYKADSIYEIEDPKLATSIYEERFQVAEPIVKQEREISTSTGVGYTTSSEAVNPKEAPTETLHNKHEDSMEFDSIQAYKSKQSEVRFVCTGKGNYIEEVYGNDKGYNEEDSDEEELLPPRRRRNRRLRVQTEKPISNGYMESNHIHDAVGSYSQVSEYEEEGEEIKNQNSNSNGKIKTNYYSADEVRSTRVTSEDIGIAKIDEKVKVSEVKANTSSISSGNRDWTREFQEILQEKDLKLRSKLMADFTSQFVDTARDLAKTIILESELPEEKKTFPSLFVGGVAGGVKYKTNNIFFKFAKDEHNIYGGDEFAAKSASMELKGLNALVNCQIDQLFFPMMCTVDYLGKRVIASSLLPICKSTLIYGSDDAGILVLSLFIH